MKSIPSGNETAKMRVPSVLRPETKPESATERSEKMATTTSPATYCRKVPNTGLPPRPPRSTEWARERVAAREGQSTLELLAQRSPNAPEPPRLTPAVSPRCRDTLDLNAAKRDARRPCSANHQV